MKENTVYDACVICGNKKGIVFSGYIFMEDGSELIGAPWCGEHEKDIGFVANPVFQNKRALELYKQKHPKIYREKIVNRKIIFLEG